MKNLGLFVFGTVDWLFPQLSGFILTVLAKHNQKWVEEDGVIRFTVTAEGISGSEWADSPEVGKRFYVNQHAKEILHSFGFESSDVGSKIEVVILKGRLFSDEGRTIRNVFFEGKRRGLEKPTTDVACLIRKKFSDNELEAMGLQWVITMHEPVGDIPIYLAACRFDGGQILGVYQGELDGKIVRDTGFAFVLPQKVIEPRKFESFTELPVEMA